MPQPAVKPLESHPTVPRCPPYIAWLAVWVLLAALPSLAADPNTHAALAADGNQNLFEIEIQQDDGYTFCFEHTAYTVDEGIGEAVLRVNLSKSLDDDIDVAFNYLELDGNPKSDTTQKDPNKWDYVRRYYTPYFARIPAGETQLILRIPIIDDQRVEVDQQVRIIALNPNRPDGQQNCTTDLTIKDNDPMIAINRGDIRTIALGDPIPFIVEIPELPQTQLTVETQEGNTQDNTDSTSISTITIKPQPLASPLTVNLSVTESGGDFISSSNEGTNKSVTIPMNATMTTYNVPSNSSNSGSGPSELTVELRGPDNAGDYFLTTPASASVILRGGRVFPPGIHVRTKAFLEGPLQ